MASFTDQFCGSGPIHHSYGDRGGADMKVRIAAFEARTDCNLMETWANRPALCRQLAAQTYQNEFDNAMQILGRYKLLILVIRKPVI